MTETSKIGKKEVDIQIQEAPLKKKNSITNLRSPDWLRHKLSNKSEMWRYK